MWNFSAELVFGTKFIACLTVGAKDTCEVVFLREIFSCFVKKLTIFVRNVQFSVNEFRVNIHFILIIFQLNKHSQAFDKPFIFE